MAATLSGVKKYIDAAIVALWEEIADIRLLPKPSPADIQSLEEKIELYQVMREEFFGDRLENQGDDDEGYDEPDEEEEEPRKRRGKR